MIWVVSFIQVLGLMKMYLFRAWLRQVSMPLEKVLRLNFWPIQHFSRVWLIYDLDLRLSEEMWCQAFYWPFLQASLKRT